MRKIVVIGGVAAGPAAAARAKRVDPNADVLLLEQGEHIAYGICELPHLVAGEVSDPALIEPYTAATFQRDHGVKVRTFVRVEEIAPSLKEVRLRDLYRGPVETLRYDRLILATGSRARPLGVSGEHAPNVHRLKTLDEGRSLAAFVEEKKPKLAVVVGAGYIGLEIAEALRLRGCAVTVVESRTAPLGGFDLPAQEAARSILRLHGVQLVLESRVEELLTNSIGWVKTVSTSSGAFVADLVVVAVGVEPETTLAEQAGIRLGESGAIRPDTRQETSVSGIFAAGDCSESRDAVTGRWRYLPLASIAARQGRTAGENAAGGSSACRDVVRAAGLRLFGTEIVQIGLAEADCASVGIVPIVQDLTSSDRVPMLKGSQETRVRVLADRTTGRIVGGTVVGPSSAAAGTMLSLAVHERLNVDALATLDAVYAPSMAPFKNPWTVAGRALRSALED